MKYPKKHCILCGSGDLNILIKLDKRSIYKCSSCGLGFLDPVPSEEELSQLYTKDYCEEQLLKGGEPGSPQFKKRLSLETHRIRFFRGLKKIGKVLDIGCGFGYFLAACRECGYEVQGLDISAWASEYASEKLGIPVKTGDLKEVDLRPGTFDVITMWHFLEHNPDPLKALLIAGDWLKDKGILVVDVPNHEGTDAQRTWRDWIGWQVPYHLYHFTPHSLEKMFNECEFQVLKSKDYHSETVKQRLKRLPVLNMFARPISKLYSGHSVAMAARKKNKGL